MRHLPHDREQYPFSHSALLGLGTGLLAVFLCLVLWGVARDWALFVPAPAGALGLFWSRRGFRRIQYRHGAVRGEEVARLGIWCNGLLLAVGVPLLLFLGMKIFLGRSGFDF